MLTQVEHYSVLTDAWNKYYVNMTGRELSDLFNTSNTSPEFLCMPSCLTVLLMVRDNFMKLQDNNKFAFSVYINDRKVYQCECSVSLIVDVFYTNAIVVFPLFYHLCRHDEDSL